MVGSEIQSKELTEIKGICDTFIAKNTISSLINEGIKNAVMDWNFLIMAGSWVHAGLDKKFSYFIDTDKDILFPIANGKTNFIDATINGLLINKHTFKEIGNWTENPLEICKLLWALEAIDKGCRFKAIAGSKVC